LILPHQHAAVTIRFFEELKKFHGILPRQQGQARALQVKTIRGQVVHGGGQGSDFDPRNIGLNLNLGRQIPKGEAALNQAIHQGFGVV
jgi:hypothetical protein